MSTSPLELIADAITAAVPEALAGVEAGAPIMLPRGADPFAGAERPLLLTATRWAAVSPGGLILGGTPAALASVLGFELPERPSPSPDAAQGRRATDQDDEDESEDAEGEKTEAEPEPDATADVEGGAESGEGADAAADAEDAAPPPARRWGDQVAEAVREPAASATDGLLRALANLVGLPHGAAATQAVLAETDGVVASTVGPLPDAIIVPLRRDGVEVRLVVVVAGIISARVAATAGQVGSAAGPGAGPVPEAEAAGASEPAAAEAISAFTLAPMALAGVPLELSAEIGTARMPLHSVLALREGAVIELQEAIDAPVALVAGATPVANGELELDDTGHLVLHVTGIPGRPDLTAGPALVDDVPPADDELDADAAPADAADPVDPVDPGEPGDGDAA